jgi:hypothetical protein
MVTRVFTSLAVVGWNVRGLCVIFRPLYFESFSRGTGYTSHHKKCPPFANAKIRALVFHKQIASKNISPAI